METRLCQFKAFQISFMKSEKRAKLIEGNITEDRPNSIQKGFSNDFPNARGIMRQQGRNMWKAAKGATKGILAIAAITTAIQFGSSAAHAAENYGRFRASGETAMADLEAIEVALSIQEITGNYFMGYMALDILLD
jgi:hypothetical protein